MYEHKNIILSVNAHNSSLRPFRVKAGSTALPAIPPFRESGSTNFSSTYPRRCRDLIATFNPLNAELNPICHLLALLGAHHILHVSGIRVKERTGNIPSARRLRVTSNKPVHSMPKFYKLSEPTVSD